MDRNDALNLIKHWPIIKAIAEERTVEFSDDGVKWYETIDPTFAAGVLYRVKNNSDVPPDELAKKLSDENDRLTEQVCNLTEEVLKLYRKLMA